VHALGGRKACLSQVSPCKRLHFTENGIELGYASYVVSTGRQGQRALILLFEDDILGNLGAV